MKRAPDFIFAGVVRLVVGGVRVAAGRAEVILGESGAIGRVEAAGEVEVTVEEVTGGLVCEGWADHATFDCAAGTISLSGRTFVRCRGEDCVAHDSGATLVLANRRSNPRRSTLALN